MFLTLMMGCSEPLPEDADGRMHAAWEAWHEGDDARLAEAVALLAESPGDGELTPLTETPGVMLVNPLPGCDLNGVEAIVIALEQDELFDVFDHYDRSYTSSLEDWNENRSPLTWRSDYGFTIPLAGAADATLLGEIREPETGVISVVNLLAEPAVWEEDGHTFDEDSRLEAWVLQDEVVVHVEALWRHMDAGAYNTENDTIRELVLNGIYDWDEQMVSLCEQGLP